MQSVRMPEQERKRLQSGICFRSMYGKVSELLTKNILSVLKQTCQYTFDLKIILQLNSYKKLIF